MFAGQNSNDYIEYYEILLLLVRCSVQHVCMMKMEVDKCNFYFFPGIWLSSCRLFSALKEMCSGLYMPFFLLLAAFILLNVMAETCKIKQVGAPARVGLIAPIDVVVPPGNTGLDPSQTSFFQVCILHLQLLQYSLFARLYA